MTRGVLSGPKSVLGLRALKAKDGPGARLVMRREDKKGGRGTG